MRESRLRQELCRRVRAEGGMAQPIEDKLTSGIPDVCVVLDGVVWWIEIKSEHVLTKAQKRWLVQWSRAGGRCAVLKNKELHDAVETALGRDCVIADGWDAIIERLRQC